jgi:hypothetical protein
MHDIQNSLIQFDTKVWENDYRIVLSERHLKKLSDSISIPSKNVRVLINNVLSHRKVELLANRAQSLDLIGDFYFVDDIASEVLKYFSIDKQSLSIGYRYSICELAGIYLSEKPYILHLSSDSLPVNKIETRFFNQSVELFKNNKDIKVTNLMWNNSYEDHASESYREDKDFYYSRGGFSDQMYFVKTEDFRKRIFNEIHQDSDRYPSYAGPLFEKRVDSWMRVNGYQRAIFKHNSYSHVNFRNRPSSSMLKILRGTNH